MKKALVTGCSGFLGRYLSKHLIDSGSRVVGLTDETGLNFDYPVYTCDIRDQKEVDRIIETEKPDIIFHLAAIASVGYSWKYQRRTYEVNLLGSLSIFEAVSKYCPKSRILCMSSAELYGKQDEICFEDSVVNIRNPYALSKYAMEQLADLYTLHHGMDLVKLRSFNFSGPGQDNKFVISDFAYQIAAIEKGISEPKIQVGNLSVQRDFSDVRDIVRYLTVIGSSGEGGQIYNLCSGKVFSIEFLLKTLLELSKEKIDVSVDQKKLRPIDIAMLYGDNTRLKKEFNLHPEYSIKNTLEDVLNYWRERV